MIYLLIGSLSFFLGSEFEKGNQLQTHIQSLEEQSKRLNVLVDKADKLDSDLKEAKKSHDKAINDLQRTHANRMRESEKRAEFYMQQAQGSTTEQYNLASHAARLDKSLSEGKTLARELRQTLEFRELQIRNLSEELINTREYLNEE